MTAKETTMILRQGDVLLIRVTLDRDADLGSPIESGEVTLAHGEATGHRHRIPCNAELYELRGTTSRERIEHARALLRDLPVLDFDAIPIGIARVNGDQELVHEEHAAIPVAGDYLALRQREYTPAEIVMVAD